MQQMVLFNPVSKFFTKTMTTNTFPGEPSAFIALTVMQGGGLPLAIEACTQGIADEMEGHFDKLGVNRQDEHLPEEA